MNNEDMVKLAEALGSLGYTIATFNYHETVNEILTDYSPNNYFETKREIELKLSLPLIKTKTRP